MTIEEMVKVICKADDVHRRRAKQVVETLKKLQNICEKHPPKNADYNKGYIDGLSTAIDLIEQNL